MVIFQVLIFTVASTAFCSADSVDPQNLTDISGLRFLLYTKCNAEHGKEQELRVDNFNTITSSHFVKNKPVKILTHGFYVSYTSEFPVSVKNAYLFVAKRYINANINVILVDWVNVAGTNYAIASVRARAVGAQIARLITILIENKYSKLHHFHHIGHSLGAQVGAFISENLPNNTMMKRVTALDSAVDNFEITIPKTERLDSSDAELVDFILTSCSADCVQRGTADFFVNGGTHQPACVPYGKFEKACNHYMAHAYFAESITTNIGFKAYRCSNYTEFQNDRRKCSSRPVMMGAYVSTRSRGTYYLNTNAGSPYAMG